MFEKRCAEPVDEARSIRFFVAEHVAQRALYKFLGQNTNSQIDSQFTKIWSQSEQACIHCSWSHNRYAHILRTELIPKRLGKIINKCFGGIVCLDSRHSHPCGHGRHIEDVSFHAFMTADTLFGFLFGQLAMQHIFAEETRHFGHRNHVQLQHEFDALHGCLAIRIEEEYSGVINENIDHTFLLPAPVVKSLRRIGQTEVCVAGYCLDIILFSKNSTGKPIVMYNQSHEASG